MFSSETEDLNTKMSTKSILLLIVDIILFLSLFTGHAGGGGGLIDMCE